MEPWPILNWKEWGKYRDALVSSSLENERWQVDRIVVPERVQFPNGFLRSEWSIRLLGRKSEAVMTFSLRPRELYLLFEHGIKNKAAPKATHSPFSLALNKWLKGSVLLDLEQPPQERCLIFWATHPNGPTHRLGLALMMIPAHPEAVLIEKLTDEENKAGPPSVYTVLASTRNPQPLTWTKPDGTKAPKDLPISDLVERASLDGWKTYVAKIHELLKAKAFEERHRTIEQSLKERKTATSKLLEKQKLSHEQSLQEPDWKLFGDYFSAVVHDPPPVVERLKGKKKEFVRVLEGFGVEIPADPALQPKQQLEKFYQLGKRKKRREEESRTRAGDLARELARLTRVGEDLLLAKTLPDLEKLEARLGLISSQSPSADKRILTSQKGWTGRSFISKDGMLIWIGKSKDENQELISKYARGNDLWLHLRGRPSAHAVIPIPSGKSASLETLLDAAELVIFYSGGEQWGKTEVDYTFRKYVKKIKGSTEVTYTHNKTLIVDPDPVRRQRLLSNAQNA